MSEKRVGVAEFKARLSEYLRAVRKGRELTIHDRDQPVARVVPWAAPTGRLQVREPVRAHGTLGDIVMPAPARLPHDVVDTLLEDRRTR